MQGNTPILLEGKRFRFLASMRPLHECRGILDVKTVRLGAVNGFNEAPARMQGNTAHLFLPKRINQCFNEAPARMQGNTFSSDAPSAKSRELQ